MGVHLLSICDLSTGIVLFEQKWQWRDGAHSTSVGNLVRSFFQLAREIDNGDIGKVMFELPSDPPCDADGLDVLGDSAPGAESRTMRMICARNEQVLAVLFDDAEAQATPKLKLKALRRSLDAALAAFTERCGERLAALQAGGQLREMAYGHATDQLDQLDAVGLTDQFQDFLPIALELFKTKSNSQAPAKLAHGVDGGSGGGGGGGHAVRAGADSGATLPNAEGPTACLAPVPPPPPLQATSGSASGLPPPPPDRGDSAAPSAFSEFFS